MTAAAAGTGAAAAAGRVAPSPSPLARPRRAVGKAVLILAGLLVLDVLLIRLRVDRARPQAFRLPAGFAVPADFEGAVGALERLTGARAAPLMGVDDAGAATATGGVAVSVPGARVGGLLDAAHDPFLERGFFLFRFDRSFGDSVPVRVALVSTRDPYDVLMRLGTSGRRDGRTVDDVIAWLHDLDRDQPLELTGMGVDWVRGRFREQPQNAHALAERIYRFCPRAVNQVLNGSVARLAGVLRARGTLYCEWR